MAMLNNQRVIIYIYMSVQRIFLYVKKTWGSQVPRAKIARFDFQIIHFVWPNVTKIGRHTHITWTQCMTWANPISGDGFLFHSWIKSKRNTLW